MAEKIYKEGEILGQRYLVQQLVGAGSFSVVYKVLDTTLSKTVALKVFKDITDVLEQLRNEFGTLEKLSHSNIARVYDVGQLPDHAYFLKLEYIEGNPLNQLINQKSISLAKAREIITDLLNAVIYLHDHHVMHRDIKPNNIIVSQRGAIIVDFNISKLVESYASSRVGTPRYMPPEVNISGWNWTGDLYALGLVLYEMITGCYPYENNTPPAISNPIDPRSHNQSISNSLSSVILKSIDKEPSKRYQTASEMLNAINNADWNVEWRPYQIPEFDLTRIVISDEEQSRVNYNPYLTRLLTLYSQSKFTNAGTRGLDELSHATYVPTKLDSNLKQDILEAQHSLVIITGNAGDGKTAFIQKLEQDVEEHPLTTHFENLDSRNGCRFIYNGIQYQTNYDGSQDEGKINNDQVLWEFFKPFGRVSPSEIHDQVRIIAINEGRLIDFFQTHQSDFPVLYTQIRDFFERDISPKDSGFIIVNLNFRAVIADNQEGLSIFDQMVARMTATDFWNMCDKCDISDKCYVKFNVDSFNDHNYGSHIRHRLKNLFQIVHLRKQLHITVRDLRSALAFILFGTENCNGIHEMLRDPNRKLEYMTHFYYNAPFALDQEMHGTPDRLVYLISRVNPGLTTNPKLDANLGFTPPSDISLLPPFDNRSDYDLKIISEWYENLQEISQNKPQIQTDSIARGFQKYHAALRCKVFFERIDKDWVKMLPFKHFNEMIVLMHDQEHSALEDIRDLLIHAISLSEGIIHQEMSQEYLCLRTSQESRVSIKSFRQFQKNHFSCRIQDVEGLKRYIEFLPTGLILEYLMDESIRMEINLDLFEMLHRIHQGYTPSLNELRGSYINLIIFKRQLSSTSYDEVLLTEDEQSFYQVQKTEDQKLMLSEIKN